MQYAQACIKVIDCQRKNNELEFKVNTLVTKLLKFLHVLRIDSIHHGNQIHRQLNSQQQCNTRQPNGNDPNFPRLCIRLSKVSQTPEDPERGEKKASQVQSDLPFHRGRRRCGFKVFPQFEQK